MPNVVLKTFAGGIVYFMRSGEFSKKIIDWYKIHHRELPWRKRKNPYHIWLSEIILQQTRVAQGLPYYEQFVRDFPNIRNLAVLRFRKY
jgi:A/G-specific adenine glycosylase